MGLFPINPKLLDLGALLKAPEPYIYLKAPEPEPELFLKAPEPEPEP